MGKGGKMGSEEDDGLKESLFQHLKPRMQAVVSGLNTPKQMQQGTAVNTRECIIPDYSLESG